MREIKFRAKTLTGELIYFNLHDSSLSGDSEVFYVGGIPCETGSEQEYTGLVDKNGKEIYEGDIIKIVCECDHAQNMEIIYKPPSFKPQQVWQHDFPDSVLNWWDRFEVVGNLCENPELFEIAKKVTENPCSVDT